MPCTAACYLTLSSGVVKYPLCVFNVSCICVVFTFSSGFSKNFSVYLLSDRRNTLSRREKGRGEDVVREGMLMHACIYRRMKDCMGCSVVTA
jgi:hypothetical protein